jgi:hypothetical protein
MNKPIRTPRTLLPEDWQLAKCPTPEEFYCLTWELAREHPDAAGLAKSLKANPRSVKQLQELWRDSLPKGRLKALKNRLLLIAGGRSPAALALVLFDGFPDTPWLRLNQDARTEFCRIMCAFAGIAKAARDSAWIIFPWEGQEGFAEHIQKELPNYVIQQFAIDWAGPNERLLDGFRRWVELNRPWDSEIISKAGKKTGHMRDLKRLGAFRLQRHHGTKKALETDGTDRTDKSAVREFRRAAAAGKQLIAEGSHSQVVDDLAFLIKKGKEYSRFASVRV